jgi:hypothetical protein
MIITTDTTDRLIESYLSALDCPRSLAIWILYLNKEHDQISKIEIRPEDYLQTKDFRDAYLASKFLSKAKFLKTKVNKKEVALNSFRESEIRCGEINRDNFRTAYLKHKSFEWIHNGAIRKIEKVLTDFSPDEFFDSANWGPGVTQLLKRDTSSTNKFRLENGITRYLHGFISETFALAYPVWNIEKFIFHAGNKVVTVPKSSKTDRTIAVEPGLNLWFQKSIGTMIRRRLRRVGINLNSQVRNQQLSRVGSKFNNLATVDFSQASDSISISTVEALLPPRWFTLMDATRSKFGSLDKTQFWYEKFSSMGNGFTFELESLIFWAIAMSVCEYLKLDTRDISVYGDDVILPKDAYQLFSDITKIYGFVVNPQKSYSSGDFRESCGSHYFRGVDCKPYYLKEVVKGESSIYLAANCIRRIAHSSQSFGCDRRFYNCWLFLRDKVKRPCFISEGYGDGGFIVDFDEACPTRARFGIEGYRTKCLLAIPIGYYSDDHALLLARLKGRSGDISFGNETNIRSRVKIIRKKILIRQWAFLGPWC